MQTHIYIYTYTYIQTYIYIYTHICTRIVYVLRAAQMQDTEPSHLALGDAGRPRGLRPEHADTI